ncbi:probable guanine nucleotide exchange factor MCF2L2 [Leptonychotes weddellii]|uniref:Probable guanine nucleotide exchange factor MCF2L2 n=1 Tax=Leptonychotes weddellii TaxID=9713 RepID=A0A7F8R4Q1_LEPWE|nr:probable guanine nucleotide exchange factor MCF2L2 [Leptonychotes weddellii]
MDFIWLKHLIPDVLQNNKEFLFGNIRELYEFHNRTFLKELEKCTENPELLARCFLKRKEDLQIYFKYHKNLPRARAIWQECQDCTFFGVCQRQLDHNLPLFKYLRGPSQRLIKYQMLLKVKSMRQCFPVLGKHTCAMMLFSLGMQSCDFISSKEKKICLSFRLFLSSKSKAAYLSEEKDQRIRELKGTWKPGWSNMWPRA